MKDVQETWLYVKRIPQKEHKVLVASYLAQKKVLVNWYFYVGILWYSSQGIVTVVDVSVDDSVNLRQIISVKHVAVHDKKEKAAYVEIQDQVKVIIFRILLSLLENDVRIKPVYLEHLFSRLGLAKILVVVV